MNRARPIKIVILIIMALLATSCFRGGKPEQRPAEEGAQLKIPESISRGSGKEPVLKVYIKETKKIKELPFEEYLQGVVAGEMKNDWPEEALAAQAILARTFVMDFISEKGGSKYEGAHVSTDIEEAQAWDEQGINDKIKKAVERTRGKVAVHDGEYIKAWFHAHAGGQTASAAEGLAYDKKEPTYIKIAKSPDSKDAPAEDRDWEAVFSKKEVIAALNKMGKKIKDVSSVSVAQRGPSGRAVLLSFDGVKVAAPEFRVAIGSTKMKSTLINSLKAEGDNIILKGKGYGHGVGMSQWGAYALAKEGKKAEDIVKHYFKGIDIVKAWQ